MRSVVRVHLSPLAYKNLAVRLSVKPDINCTLKTARTASDNAYRALVKMVNALALVFGEKDYTAFIDYVNTEITHFKREVMGQKATAPSTSGSSSATTPSSKPSSGGSSSGSGSSTGDGETVEI